MTSTKSPTITASNQRVSFDSTTHTVHIHDLSISDTNAYLFLSEKKDPAMWVEKAVAIGCVGLRQITTVENVDFVQKEFQRFSEGLNRTLDPKHKDSPLNYFLKELDGYFDEEKGKMRKMLDSAFDIDNENSSFHKLLEGITENSDLEEETIKELLDTNKTDSPMQLFKKELLEKFKQLREEEIKSLGDNVKDIRDRVLGEEAAATERERGTGKGLDFETEIFDCISKYSNGYEDCIRHLGTTQGSSSKVGDIEIAVAGDVNKKIVIECKDSGGYSVRKTTEEVEEARKNRNADFCVFVFNKPEQMPGPLYPIKLTENYIITCHEGNNLYFAYRLARMMLLKNSNGSTIDIEQIHREVDTARSLIETIRGLERKASTIITSGKEIKDGLGDIKESLEASLDSIDRLLLPKEVSTNA